MHEIKSFRIFQTAKVVGVLYAISFAIVAAIQLLAFAILGGQRPPIILIVLLPIFGSIFSFIGIAIGCWLYNLIAPSIGGIAFELTPRGGD
jgi:hypothetical protein